MAFSLESSLVLPVCLILVSSSLIAAHHIDRRCDEAAGLEIVSTFYRYNASRLYQQVPVRYNLETTLALETSPARLIQLAGLLQDNLKYIGRLLPGQDTDEQGDTGQQLPVLVQTHRLPSGQDLPGCDSFE